MSELKNHITKNKNIQIYIDGALCHRDEAKVSVFDTVF